MKRIWLKDLKNYADKEIEISGFVDSIRNLQWVIFMILRDGSGKVQITIEKSDDNNSEIVKLFDSLTLESTVKVKGTLKINEKVKLNGMEFIPTNIEITSLSANELPIDIKNKDNALRETRLDNRFLDLRREDNHLLFEIQTFMEQKMREYWTNNNYMEIHSPKISAASAESGAEQFKINYFGQDATLSQSPQFYKQMAIAAGFDRVFEISQVYRAENSHTSYHATEIQMLDSEIGWINSVEDVMDEEEAWIKYFLGETFNKYGDVIKNTFNVEAPLYDNKWPRIDFWEAKEILKSEFNYVGEVPEDFERKEEELMCKYAKDKFNSDFIFITHYPWSARSFYVMRDENGITQSYDLLYRGLEITSGAQREHRADILENQIKDKGLNPDDLRFYLDFFKYGCPPHGGFGVGMGRIMMQTFNIDNIREATFIYRGPTRLNP